MTLYVSGPICDMQKIKQVLAQEDTILFIGSGISTWSGLPSWSGMMEELARFVESAGANADLVRAEVNRGDLLQAASYGFDKLTKPQIGEFIRSACRYGVAEPHEILQKIVSLGPRFFVTTNYDDLIEQSLRKWQPDRFYPPPVTNRHLTEIAEIVHARAIDFIFKPHGDAADSESIVLTREQYRQLLPQGERHAALEALMMLLATRPVVYLGFSLRDPDFMYLRDLLANTYKGGTRDHYSIMADVSEAEIDYWRRQYGIHLFSYATTEGPDKTRDHTALLTLLDTLLEADPVTPTEVDFDPRSPDVVLALARHASGLMRTPKLTPEFQIRVHAENPNRRNDGRYHRRDRFDYDPVEEFLDYGPGRAVLIGLPGAGKTYSLRRAAARLAENLNERCLSEQFDDKSVVVPIFADLKLYRGDLGELVSQTLPMNLPLDEITQRFKVKIFLDSFNEMPREYWESGSYESDFAEFTTRIGDSLLIISSRTSDGLTKLDLPTYSLDLIDHATVAAELERLDIEIEGRFVREVWQLLQRPFYFQYIISGAVNLPKEPRTRDFFDVFFKNLREDFVTRFSGQIDIEKALSLAAYDALNQGEEPFPLTNLFEIINASLESSSLADIDVHDIANWLVASSVLIPYTGGRVAFVHQSVTEYLAATELARRYRSTPDILKERLKLTRWDQALFLTLSLLPPTEANLFLQDVMKADFLLALNAVRYLEENRDEVVNKLLSEIPEQVQILYPSDYRIYWALEHGFPVTDSHVPRIRALVRLGGSIGAAAVLLLVELKGEEVKEELLQLLVDDCGDYNLCEMGIGPALRQFATEEDANKIAGWADSIRDKFVSDPDDETMGFTNGAGVFLSGLDLSVIRREFLPAKASLEVSKCRADIMCKIIQEHRSTAALDLAGELLLRGVKEAAFAMYLISEYPGPNTEMSFASFTPAHVECLVSILDNAEEQWALDALVNLCAARSDLRDSIQEEALKNSGIKKAALLFCVTPADTDLVFQALGELIGISNENRQQQSVSILHNLEIDWAGNEALLVELLRLRDTQLASVLLGGGIPVEILGLGNLEIGQIGWWLEWITEVDSTPVDMWFLDQLGSLFAGYLERAVQDEFVAEFNKPGSKFRRVLTRYVLSHRDDLTTDEISEDAISFLLADLSREQSGLHSHRRHLLGNIATERFVTERLTPLIRAAKPPLLKNLRLVLRQVGSRHGRRYISEELA